MDTYEIVVRERFSTVLIEATATDSASFAAGMTAFVANDCDQIRLNSLFSLLRDLNVSRVSVNAVETATPKDDGR